MKIRGELVSELIHQGQSLYTTSRTDLAVALLCCRYSPNTMRIRPKWRRRICFRAHPPRKKSYTQTKPSPPPDGPGKSHVELASWLEERSSLVLPAFKDAFAECNIPWPNTRLRDIIHYLPKFKAVELFGSFSYHIYRRKDLEAALYSGRTLASGVTRINTAIIVVVRVRGCVALRTRKSMVLLGGVVDGHFCLFQRQEKALPCYLGHEFVEHSKS